MVTGTSVLGVTFGDGVMLAADTLGKLENKSVFAVSDDPLPCHMQVPTDPSLVIEVYPGCTRQQTAACWEQLVTLLTFSSWGVCLMT